MKKQKYGFGPHLMIDAYGCNQKSLNDVGLIYDVMERITKLIKMNPITPPIIKRATQKDITRLEDTGVSGIIMFAESHFSFHGFDKKRFFVADIFSCKKFDLEIVKAELKKTFKAKKIQTHFVQRGIEFPRSD